MVLQAELADLDIVQVSISNPIFLNNKEITLDLLCRKLHYFNPFGENSVFLDFAI